MKKLFAQSIVLIWLAGCVSEPVIDFEVNLSMAANRCVSMNSISLKYNYWRTDANLEWIDIGHRRRLLTFYSL